MAGETPDSTATVTPPPETQGAMPGEQAPQIEQSPEGRAAEDWSRTAGPQTQGAMPGQAAPQIEQQPTTVPVPVTPLKRGGIFGVMDSVADALVGKTRPELGKDPDGNMYVKQRTLSHGEQWARIAGKAVAGAAAGFAAGRGSGGEGRAAVAGIQAGERIDQNEKNQFKQQTDDETQMQLSNANNQMLRMKLAEEAWRGTRLQTEAGQHDIEFAQGQEDRLAKAGATLLGTAAHAGDISDLQKINPDLAKDLVQNHSLEFVPHYDAQGKPAGFKVYKTSDGYRSNVLPKGAQFPTFNNVTGQYDWHQASDPTTQGDIDDYWTAAGVQAQKWKSDKAEQDLKAQQAATSKEQARLVPSEINKNNAAASEAPSVIAKNTAEGAHATAEANKVKAEAGEGPEGDALVDLIGSGRADVGKLAYLASRNPALLEKVAKKYPGFNPTKISGFAKLYNDFTSGKASIALNAGGTALEHMQNLMMLNTPMSHIWGTPDYTAYHNQLDTLAPELANFYGDHTIPAIQSLKSTLGATAPGNRARAIKTQAKSMSAKFDSYEQQWNTAAPSAAYTPQMPQMTDARKQIRAEFDPKYKARQVQEQQSAPVTVQLPGHPPGQIPASALEQFKKDYPDAVISQ